MFSSRQVLLLSSNAFQDGLGILKGRENYCNQRKLILIRSPKISMPQLFTKENDAYRKISSRLEKEARSNEERPKAAVKANRGFVVLRYGIHIVAILSTIAISCINYMNVFWAGEETTNINAQIGLFQFVARLHESLLVTSLTTIVFDRVRQGLLSSNGIPIGHLLAAQQIQLPNFVISGEFWKSMGAYEHNPFKSRLSLGFLLMLSAPFILVSGPLSAILLVPRLDWGSPMPVNLSPLLWNISAARFWPNEVSASLVPPKCKTNSAVDISSCPASAFEPVVDGLSPATFGSLLQNGHGNMTMTKKSTFQRELSIDGDISHEQLNSPSTAVASTLSYRTFEDFTNYWISKRTQTLKASEHQKLITTFSGNTEMLKPLVRTYCHASNVSDDSKLDLIGSTSRSEATLQSLNLSHVDWSRPTFAWNDGTSQEGKSILGGIFTYSLNRTVLGKGTEFDCGFYCRRILICPVEASWVPVKIWIDSQNDNFVYQDMTGSYTPHNTLVGKSRPIVIRKDWAELLTLAPLVQAIPHLPVSANGSVASFPQDFSFIETMMMILSHLDGFVNINTTQRNTTHTADSSLHKSSRLRRHPGIFPRQYSPHKRRNILADKVQESFSCYMPIILSTTVAEALSRLHFDSILATWEFRQNMFTRFCPDGENEISAGCSFTSPADTTTLNISRSNGFKQGEWMQLNFRAQRYGWGWFTNSIVVYLALVTLLLHAAFTLLYLTVAFRHKDVPVAWGRVSELLVLALNSLPSKLLTNTSAGVEQEATWKNTVKVREIDDGKRLSLVFAGDFEHGERVGYRPQVGKKYE